MSGTGFQPMPAAEHLALRSRLLEFSLRFPGSYVDHPWGEDVAKVDNKVFVFLGVGDTSSGFLMGVKLPVSAMGALTHACAEPMGYGLGKSGWVHVRHDRGPLPPIEVLEDWIEESYRAVATKKRRAELDAARVG